MERVYSRRWAQVLVQHRDKDELLGDARGLQECAGSDTSTGASYTFVSRLGGILNIMLTSVVSRSLLQVEGLPIRMLIRPAIATTMAREPALTGRSHIMEMIGTRTMQMAFEDQPLSPRPTILNIPPSRRQSRLS
jgi:hypothetical protein